MSAADRNRAPGAEPAKKPHAPAGKHCPKDGTLMQVWEEAAEVVHRCNQCHWTERSTQSGIVTQVQPGLGGL